MSWNGGGVRRSAARLCGATLLMAFAATVSVGRARGQESPDPGKLAENPHLLAAQEAQHRNDYSAAEREYKAVLAELPRSAELHMNLGLIYQLEGRVLEAMVEFERSLKLNPELAGANFMLGVDLCKQGEGRKAAPYLEAALKRDPTRVEVSLWLATAEEMSGAVAQEIATLEHALELEPTNPDLLYQLGQGYERLGRMEIDRKEGAGLGASFTEELLGDSYATSGDWPTSILHYESALAASPGRRGLQAKLGEGYLRAGKLDRAAEEFKGELLVDPHGVRALLGRGEVELIEGDVDGGLRDWAEALRTDRRYSERVLGMGGGDERGAEQLQPKDVERLKQIAPELERRGTGVPEFALAYIAGQGGRREAESSGADKPACTAAGLKAAASSGRVSELASCGSRLAPAKVPVELRPAVAGAMLEFGAEKGALRLLGDGPAGGRALPEEVYLRARCYERLSTRAYVQLYQTNPDSYRAHQLMADLAAAKNDDRKAAEEYRAALALRPTAPNLHYSLGHVLWKSSDVGGARPEFEAELAINPRHAGALRDLGDTYLMEHQPQKALEYFERVLAEGGETPDLDRDLGTAYAQAGEYRKAEAKFELALPTDRDGSVHFKLGRAYAAMGEKEKAAREFALSAELNRKLHSKLEEQTPRRYEIER